MKYRLSDLTDKTYDEIALEFDEYFTRANYKKPNINSYSEYYECSNKDIIYWIDTYLVLEKDIDYYRFRSGLRYHLRKIGWRYKKQYKTWTKKVFL
jgi:hypothetical protein